MTTGVVSGPVDSASAPPSSGRGNYLPTQSQASYYGASSSPSACRPSSGFDVDNEEADVRANVAVAEVHANVRASAVMTDDNDNDADDGNFDDTLCEILGASSRVTTSLDLDLAFGAVDSNVNLACTPLLSPLFPLPPNKLFSLPCNKLFSLSLRPLCRKIDSAQQTSCWRRFANRKKWSRTATD